MFNSSYNNDTVLKLKQMPFCIQLHICFCSHCIFFIFPSPLKKVFGNDHLSGHCSSSIVVFSFVLLLQNDATTFPLDYLHSSSISSYFSTLYKSLWLFLTKFHYLSNTELQAKAEHLYMTLLNS